MVAPTHDRSPLGMARMLQNFENDGSWLSCKKWQRQWAINIPTWSWNSVTESLQLSVMLFGAEVMRPSCFEEAQWLFLLRKFALSYCYDQNSMYWYCWFIHSNLATLSDFEFSRNSHLTSKGFFTHGKHLSSLHDASLILLTHRTCYPEPTPCNFMFLIPDCHLLLWWHYSLEWALASFTICLQAARLRSEAYCKFS